LQQKQKQPLTNLLFQAIGPNSQPKILIKIFF